jgi:hypothetical protein
MDHALYLSFERVERRLALMRELAGTLEQAQAALLASDLQRIEEHTARQRELCDALRLLEAPATSPGKDVLHEPTGPDLPKASLPPELHERWSALSQELAQVQSRVGHLNRVHAALLRRAQRALAIVSRLLASSAVTYTLPQPATPAELGGRR